MNPKGSLTRVPEPNEEKLQHNWQKQQFVSLKSGEGDRIQHLQQQIEAWQATRSKLGEIDGE